MSAIDNLLTLSGLYMDAERVESTTLSWRMFNDSKKLDALHDGADLGTRRCERAIQWLSDNWPKGAVWPKAVRRPETVGAAR